MPKPYFVERSIRIEASPESVFDLLQDFRKWPKWSPWEELDPNLKRDYSGADYGTGATYAWEGNKKAGKGNMHLTEAVAPSNVLIDLTFEKPFASNSVTQFTVTPEGSGSVVRWTMSGAVNGIVRVMSVFWPMEKMIGPDFEKGLAKLKAAAETPA